MFDLSGKIALVTGASGGIGKSIATALHRQGAITVLTARRKDRLEELASELSKNVHSLACDLSNPDQLSSLIEQAGELAGDSIDILVCNAGITRDNLTLRMKEDEWQQVIDTNLSATFTLNKSALKRMLKKRWGRIINISSVVGVTGNAGQANYAASKAGMIAMSKSIASETASRGITINCIAPGFIKTDMTDALSEEQANKITQTIPTGTFGLPDDIAAATAFLASNEANYITGQTLHINGGMAMI